MSSDQRTMLNDCEVNTGWTGDDTATAVNDPGLFYEGANSLSTQLSDADEQMSTTQDSVGMTTFAIDMSDFTLYLLVKDNLGDSAANGGVQFVVGDATPDLIGYDVGGNDAPGISLPTYFQSYKLDMSNRPAAFTVFAGIEANLDDTAITAIGYGSLHLSKAVGAVDNVFMDAFRYIANGSFALRINGGTSGTPETMADVAGDDVTNGWGMVSNPIGAQFLFFAPTEWGEPAAAVDHFFTATNEQWFWLGDNGGGHAVGATHFPFRVVSNGGVTTSLWQITNVVIVNTGTGAEFDCSSTDVDTLEILGCTMIGLASFAGPSSGGTSRFCTDTIFNSCGQITHNGGDMSRCSVQDSIVAANAGAVLYNEAVDPDGETDGMIFVQGAAAHHALEFGTSIPLTITLRDMDFTGFSASNDNDGSVFKFLDIAGNITLNLVNCTHDGSGFTVDDRAGVTVTVVIDPVTTEVNVTDDLGVDLQNAVVYLEAADAAGDLPFNAAITSITRAGTVATVTHTAPHGLATNNLVKIKGITDKTEDNNGTHQITVTSTTVYTYVTTDSGSVAYTGTITATGVIFNTLTSVAGQVSDSRTFSIDQAVTGQVRFSTNSPRFKTRELDEIIDSATGLIVNVRLIPDE